MVRLDNWSVWYHRLMSCTLDIGATVQKLLITVTISHLVCDTMVLSSSLLSERTAQKDPGQMVCTSFSTYKLYILVPM